MKNQRITSKRDYHEFLAADMAAHNLREWRFFRRYTHPELYYQRLLRRVEYLLTRRTPTGRLLYASARFRLARYSVRTGISIPPGVFGPGLSIAHYGSIVVNDLASVGARCRIHSSTNIGISEGGAPVIGDNSYIGPGAVIYGGITIGDDVAVGANSVVNRDVPNKVVVAGAPARIVSTEGSRRSLPDWMGPGRTSDRALMNTRLAK